MTLALYVPTPSPLHRLHPLTKVAGFVALMLAAFLVTAPGDLMALAAVVAALLAMAGAGPLVRRFRTLFVVVFLFTVLVWTFFFRTVLVPTRTGFAFGIATGLRLDTLLAMGLLFLATTRVEEVAWALDRLGVPYTAGFTLTLAFRLVPLFFDAAATVVAAQRCRGLRLDEGGVVTRLRRFVPVIVPVFVGALRRADRMAMALELRGFNSGRPRTSFVRATAGARDAAAAGVACAIAVAAVLRWLAGAGVVAR